ncbi:MAG: hypothetical protein HZB42_01520 [Sphingobacteriales bacterium]|nr:hypothetical protein [Sphingobacteriales bacterium]
MKKGLLFLIIFLFTYINLYSQFKKNIKVNALSFELGKTGLIYNLNFDHRIKNKNIGYRASIGSNFAKYLNVFSAAGGGYFLIGKKKILLEIGIDAGLLNVDEISDDQRGLTLIYPDYSIKTFYSSLNAGVRIYSQKSLFRAGVSPGIIKDGFLPGGYISFGFLF